MRKLNECLEFGKVVKVYRADEDYEVARLIEKLLDNSIEINSVRFTENVELELQTFGSENYGSLDDFLHSGNIISSPGQPVTYSFKGRYNGEKIDVVYDCGTNNILIRSKDEQLELEDLIGEK